MGVIIGMDPHKRSATIEVIDEQARVLAAGRYGTDKDRLAPRERRLVRREHNVRPAESALQCQGNPDGSWLPPENAVYRSDLVRSRPDVAQYRAHSVGVGS